MERLQVNATATATIVTVMWSLIKMDPLMMTVLMTRTAPKI